MIAMLDVMFQYYNLFLNDSVLSTLLDYHRWNKDTEILAVFANEAPPQFHGNRYMVIRAEENPDEDYGRKRMLYSVDVYDGETDAEKALQTCKRIEVLIQNTALVLSEGQFIRAWLDIGPLPVLDKRQGNSGQHWSMDLGQHWSMDFVIEYSDNQII